MQCSEAARAHAAVNRSHCRTQRATYNLQHAKWQHAICSTQHTEHSMEHAACNTQHATRSAQHATCNSQDRATRNMQHAAQRATHATRSMQQRRCNTQHTDLDGLPEVFSAALTLDNLPGRRHTGCSMQHTTRSMKQSTQHARTTCNGTDDVQARIRLWTRSASTACRGGRTSSRYEGHRCARRVSSSELETLNSKRWSV
jgi:hypothetical protein